jgi:hypothetical protein
MSDMRKLDLARRLLQLLHLRLVAEEHPAAADEQKDATVPETAPDKSRIIDRTAECAGMGFQIIGAKMPRR